MLLDQCMNLRGDNTTSRVGHGDLTDCRDRLRTCNFRKNESIHQCKFNGRLYIKLAPERDKQNNSTLLRAKYLTNFSSWMIIVISVDECLPTVSDFESALWLAQLYTMEAQGYIPCIKWKTRPPSSSFRSLSSCDTMTYRDRPTHHQWKSRQFKLSHEPPLSHKPDF